MLAYLALSGERPSRDWLAAFLWPEYDWEIKGMTGYTTVSNALIPFKTKWMLYYGGADTVAGLASCPMA